MNFSALLQEIRDAKFSDIQIAEELSKISKTKVSRQQVYNYRTNLRPNPALFAHCVAIIKLHRRIIKRPQEEQTTDQSLDA